MLKYILLLGICLVSVKLPAQPIFWGQKYCWGWARYMDYYNSTEDGLYYGYVDNINYPDTYGLPMNYQFNYCPPCRAGSINCTYMRNCIQYSTVKRCPPPLRR